MNKLNEQFPDVQIREIEFDGRCKIAILEGGFTKVNPKEYMDYVVSCYVQGSSYNEFVESHLDMPCIRIVLLGINDIKYKPYNGELLRNLCRNNG